MHIIIILSGVTYLITSCYTKRVKCGFMVLLSDYAAILNVRIDKMETRKAIKRQEYRFPKAGVILFGRRVYTCVHGKVALFLHQE